MHTSSRHFIHSFTVHWEKENFINAHQMYPFTIVKAFHLATSISLKELLAFSIYLFIYFLFFRDFQAMKYEYIYILPSIV